MKTATPHPNNWYVVYTYPNAEKKIYNELSKHGIPAFLPTRQEVRNWSDRKKKFDVPLFPNYVFVNLISDKLWTVLTISGVVRFITFNGAPAVIKDQEIAAVRQLLSVRQDVKVENAYVKGEHVQVMQGPFMGLVGRVSETKGITRLYVELETIHQTLSVDIDAAMLDKVEA